MIRNTVIVEIQSGDKVEKIGFKCGMQAIGIACRKSGAKNVNELFQLMAAGDMLTALSLYYGCAIQYSGNEAITMDQVSDWIEQMGEEKALEVQSILFEFFKKNLRAPEQTGAIQATQ